MSGAPKEAVNHPAHYNAGRIEVITVIEDWKLGFHLATAVKYIGRCDHKEDRLMDLLKARWYLDREIQNTTPRCLGVSQGDCETPPPTEAESRNVTLVKYLMETEVTSENIDAVRRSLYDPIDSKWNEMVRDYTESQRRMQLKQAQETKWEEAE